MGKNKTAKSNSNKSNSVDVIEDNPFKTIGKNNLICAIILFLSGLVIYWNSVHFEYVLDDTLVITKNNYVQEGFAGIGKIFSTESFQGYFGEQKNLLQGARYRPLSIVSFAIEQGLWGSNPFRAHLTNIIMYGLCCVFIYLVFLKLLNTTEKANPWLSLAFVTALLFTLHPVHVEAVANVKGRDEIMAVILSFASLYFSLKSLGKNKILWTLLLATSYFLALLAKENSMTFLLIIPLSLYFFKGVKWKDQFIVFGSLLLVTILYLLMRIQIIGYLFGAREITDIMNNPFYGLGMGEKYATIFYTLLEYLRLGFYPKTLTHDYYPYHVPIMQWSDIQPIASVIIYLVLGVLGIWGMGKKAIWSYAILFFLISFSIVSNIFVGVGTFMNERFLFMPSIGICLGLAYLLVKKGIQNKNKYVNYLAMILLASFILGFGYRSITRVPVWENGMTLNSAAIQVSKNSARANSFMSTALFKQGQASTDRNEKLQAYQQGMIYANKAIEIMPHYKNANLMKAGMHAELHKLDRDLTKLLAGFKEVMIRRPDISYLTQYLEYINGRSADSTTLLEFYYDSAYENLHKKYGNHQWAEHYLKMAYGIDPKNPKINFALASVYKALNNPRSAQLHQSNYEQSLGQQQSEQ